MMFEPDYRHFSAVTRNKRPDRLTLYEHSVAPEIMEKVLGESFAGLIDGDAADRREFFRSFCRFFREMTYDVVSYEVGIIDILPGENALLGGRGPIQTRADFDAYPWAELPARYREWATPRFDALVEVLPPDTKVVGGVGYGVFELAEALVGLEFLSYMQVDDPELYADLFQAIGDLMYAVWAEFLPRYGAHFVACRFGDDLGFRSSLLTNPRTVRDHILPQYARVIDAVHAHHIPFLWHSCGCVFEIMDDVIALGIDAKHSNEDAIAPFETWIDRYNGQIALLGGFDMDFLCSKSEAQVYDAVLDQGRMFREKTKGYALGSGNSIPDYMPVENLLAMLRAAQTLRDG